jgi:hypothetical protein
VPKTSVSFSLYFNSLYSFDSICFYNKIPSSIILLLTYTVCCFLLVVSSFFSRSTTAVLRLCARTSSGRRGERQEQVWCRSQSWYRHYIACERPQLDLSVRDTAALRSDNVRKSTPVGRRDYCLYAARVKERNVGVANVCAATCTSLDRAGTACQWFRGRCE